jgi:hypothetical protein
MRIPTYALGTLLIFIVASGASGSIVTLSDVVSDGPNPPPASELLADLFFELPGPVGDNVAVALPTTLTLTIDNRTDETTLWDISEFYFNVPVEVTGMTLSKAGWTETFDNAALGGTMVNGFGMFDMGVVDGQGGNPHQILPGETDSFVFTLTGSGSITELDFSHNEFSELEPGGGGSRQWVAAKFVNGPGDASAFGAVPEPGAMALLVLGGLVAVRRRNR